MSAARALALILLALLAVGATPAAADPLLDPGDAAELANQLAEATEEQDVCYGWDISVNDSSGGPSGREVGSNFGPGVGVDEGPEPCTNQVVVVGGVDYTCGSCESEDSSGWDLRSSFPAVRESDLKDLGFGDGGLEKDDGDVKLASMVGALPLIVSSEGLAPALVAEPVQTSTVPPGDKATGSPVIPDWLRDHWLGLAALVLLVGAGVLLLVSTLGQERMARRMEASRNARRTTIATTTPDQEP